MAIPNGFPKVIALVRATESSQLYIYKNEDGTIITKAKNQLIKECYERFGTNNYVVFEAVEELKTQPIPIE